MQTNQKKKEIIALSLAASFRLLAWLTEYIYLPTLPLLLFVFDTSRQALQLSLVFYLFGIFFSQILGGKIASVAGNKTALILKLLIAIIGTIIVMTAHSIHPFIWGRFIQGLGIGLGFSLGNVLIHDAFVGDSKKNKTVAVLSYLGLIAVWFPGLAMILGAYIYEWVGWRANFAVLLILFIFQIIFLVLFLPGSKTKHKTFQLSEYIKQFAFYKQFLISKEYRAYVISKVLISGGITAYLLASTFIFHEYYRLSATTIGYLVLFLVAGQSIGKALNILLSEIISRRTSMVLGLSLSLAASIAMFLGLLFSNSILHLLIPLIFYAIGGAILPPQATAEVLMLFPKQTINAQALMSALGTLSAALLSSISIIFHPHYPLALAALLLALSAVAFFYFTLLTHKKA